MIHDSDQVLFYHIVPNLALVGVPLSRRHRCRGYPLVLSYYREARMEALRVWYPNAKLTQFFEDEVLRYIYLAQVQLDLLRNDELTNPRLARHYKLVVARRPHPSQEFHPQVQ